MDIVPLEVEDPIAAATHADPYPLYARLVAERPLAWDATHRLWVAASAEAVRGVLAHPACRVRPPAEPVPASIAATPMGALYARWLRMTEGQASREGKRAVATALEALTPEVVDLLGSRVRHALAPGPTSGPEAVMDIARSFLPEFAPEPTPKHEAVTDFAPSFPLQVAPEPTPKHEAVTDFAPSFPLQLALGPEAVTDFAFAFPLQVVGGLLGLPSEVLPSVARATRRLAEGVSPLASAAEREAGAHAAVELVETLARAEGGLLLELLGGVARQQRLEPEWVRANAVGLLFQTCEATAGLIGNTLLALARAPEWLARTRERPALLASVVEEVVRFDPPVQNTRRFVAEDAELLGASMRAGQGILVLLAAANRDPALHAAPHRFDPERPQPRSFTFGSGAHACPGSRLAVTVASSAVRHLLERGVEPAVLSRSFAYRPSVNGRIPLFSAPPVGVST